jgi:predicted DNA-binding transcriptional regulator AlpA
MPSDPIDPKHIIDGMTARRLCQSLNQRRVPLSRNTFGRWRRDRAFPDPIITTESGVELWDERQVKAWVKHQRIVRKFRVARD